MKKIKHATKSMEWQNPKYTSKINKEKTAVSVYCQNKFMVLSADDVSDDKHENENASMNTYTKENIFTKTSDNMPKNVKSVKRVVLESNKQCYTKPRLLIMSDSHGKNLSNIIQQKTNINVTAVVRSGAMLSGVFREANELTLGYNQNDFVLVIGGTNNVEGTSVKDVLNDFDTLLEMTKNTNLIVASLPMRHDKPNLDDKISLINEQLINRIKITATNIRLLELHLLPRDLYTRQGMHFNRKGKRKIGEVVLRLLRDCCFNHAAITKKKISQPSPEDPVIIVEEDMNTVIHKLRDQNEIAFAHCISTDFHSNRHMSAGVATTFKKHFNTPLASDFVSERLTYQLLSTSVYGLVTKPTYNSKPTVQDYDTAFKNLTQHIKQRELSLLVCSPMGCVRDNIPLELFITKLYQLHLNTSVKIMVVVSDEHSTRVLRNGLTYLDFVKGLRSQLEIMVRKDSTENFSSDKTSLQGSTTNLCCSDIETTLEGPTTSMDDQLHSPTGTPVSSLLNCSISDSEVQGFTTPIVTKPQCPSDLINSLHDQSQNPNLNLPSNSDEVKNLISEPTKTT
ncbi:hypothetical protein J6590_016111 [Homalodisca vitripennis]|nr:hypothetical protein J6590_016111 [Homalodisca vitripennis]